MTEEELDWHNSILREIEKFASVRKMLLIAAPFVRELERLPEFEESKRCSAVMERVADEPVSMLDLELELHDIPGTWTFTHIMFRQSRVDAANELRKLAAFFSLPNNSKDHRFTLEFALREVLGNPFRPVAFSPDWRSPTVLALANGIYAERAFDRLPILADALEEAGCDNSDILSHARGPGPHVRGCWVVDLVLGKE